SGVGVSAAYTADALATGWLVLQLTDSPFWLGLVAGTRGISQLVFSIVGGTIADRMDLRRLLVQNNLINATLAIVVLVLVVTGACCLLPLPRGGELHPAEAPLRSLVSGLRYVLRTERIRELLLLSFTTEAFGFAHQQMVPVMARDVLHVGADGLGLLSASAAAG